MESMLANSCEVTSSFIWSFCAPDEVESKFLASSLLALCLLVLDVKVSNSAVELFHISRHKLVLGGNSQEEVRHKFATLSSFF